MCHSADLCFSHLAARVGKKRYVVSRCSIAMCSFNIRITVEKVRPVYKTAIWILNDRPIYIFLVHRITPRRGSRQVAPLVGEWWTISSNPRSFLETRLMNSRPKETWLSSKVGDRASERSSLQLSMAAGRTSRSATSWPIPPSNVSSERNNKQHGREHLQSRRSFETDKKGILLIINQVTLPLTGYTTSREGQVRY